MPVTSVVDTVCAPVVRVTRYPVTPLASVLAVHESVAEVADVAVAVSAPGIVGAMVSGAAGVVSDVVAGTEVLPAASRAVTDTAYVVSGSRPVTSAVVPVTSTVLVAPPPVRVTVYAVTSASGLAVQARVAVVGVVVPVRPVGAPGAVVSAGALATKLVKAETEILPAASRARTRTE